MAWQQIDNTNSAGWGVIGTSQTAAWAADSTVNQVLLDATAVFGGAAFSELAFAGEQQYRDDIGGTWEVIEV